MNTTLPVVILAGGLGTRVQLISRGRAKALIPIAGKPFLDWKLRELSAQGVKEVYLLVHHLASDLRTYVDELNQDNLEITLIPDGEVKAGTGGALVAAASQLPPNFILTYGDNLLCQKIVDFQAAFFKDPSKNLLVVTQAVTSEEACNVRMEESSVLEYSKTPVGDKFNYLDYGYSIWNTATIKQFEGRPLPFELSVIFSETANRGSLNAFVTEDEYFEIGTPNGFKRAEHFLLSIHNQAQ